MKHRCCNDFSRTALMRRAVAEAGRGLPSIEPGMPLPAGTGMSRQSFLLRTGGLALALYGLKGLRPGAIEAGIARAAAGPANPIIVSIFMEGGVDGLTVLYPANNPTYVAKRPHLKLPAVPGHEFSEAAGYYWHDKALPLRTLHEAGKVTVLPAVGYTDPDQSHFTSRHYWEVGELNTQTSTGWLGRYLDVAGAPDNPLQGLSLDGQLSPTLATASVPVAAIEGAPYASYNIESYRVWDNVEDHMLEALHDLGVRLAGDSDAARHKAGTVTVQSHTLHDQLEVFSDTPSPPDYPADSSFAQQLASLAKLIAAGLPLRCVSLNAAGGYDTHSDQAQSLADDLDETAKSIAAFQKDIEDRGVADNVIVQVWSEFGRRPEENGSGTDHGAAGVGFIIGTKVKGEMVGEPADLDSLDEDDNLIETVDFRAVYCSILEQWFDTDATGIVPGAAGFSRPQIIKP